MSAVRLTRALRLLLCLVVCVIVRPAGAQFEVETKHNDVGPAPVLPRGDQLFRPDEKPVGGDDVEIDPFLLGTIRHRTLKVRDVEVNAFYKVLEHARQVKYDLQKRVAGENVKRHETQFRQQPANARFKFSLFADIFTHPEEYTGELVTMKGYVRKNIQNPDDPDEPNPVPSYEAWLFSTDAQHNPVCIVYSELPKGMPLGSNLVETVEVTGYFFKVYGYRAQDGLRAAPMLLARTIEWTPKVVRDTTVERTVYFLVTGALVVGLVFVFWTINRRQHERLAKATREPEDFDPRELQSLTFESAPEPKIAIETDQKATHDF